MIQPTNQIIYDWLSFTTKIHNLSEVIDLLDFRPDTVRFKQEDKGRYFYRKSLYYEGIHIYYDGFTIKNGDQGICVEMSGKGLRNWEEYSSADYDKLFDLILANYSDDPDQCKMKLTRLDVAYDDFEGLLDLPYIFTETLSNNFVSRLKTQEFNCKRRSGKNIGLTVSHGSMQSNLYIRIYDKRLEQKAQEILKHWVRCEIQLRHEDAMGFIKLKTPIEKSYFDVLNNYLRYVVPSDDTNDRRASTAPFWLKFIRSAEAKSIFNKPKNDYKIENLMGYVENQLSGSIKTYMDIFGVDNFLRNINQASQGKPLNPKYKTLKEQSEANGNALLEYLKEHGLE